MSTGPIEFARSVGVDVGETEYGGGPGLVQKGDHLEHLDTGERLGILRRSGSSVVEEVEIDEDGVTTIVQTVVALGIDPVTGLTLEEAASEEVRSDSVKPVL